VRTVEQIVEQIRAAAGGDFAFVLTRKGRLVTYRAPREMPEDGRNRLVRAARPLLGTDRIVAITLPREELVPFGGAAPVDVYLGVAAEQAIVCVVMASWADMARAEPALSAGLRAIEPLLRRGLPAGKRSGDLGPVKGSPYVGDRRTRPPESLPADLMPPEVKLPRPESLPEIHVGEAELGRLSMIAIRHDVNPGGSSPEITFGDAELGRQSMVAVRRELFGASSAPEIILGGEASLGRESLAAIDREGRPRETSSPEAIHVELVSMPEIDLRASNPRSTIPIGLPPPRPPAAGRLTMPWVEAPADTKRAVDAANVGRKLSPPRVTLKLEEVDEGVLDAANAEIAGKR
jgi:hypothetical protein